MYVLCLYLHTYETINTTSTTKQKIIDKFFCGASDGSRTRAACLEGRNSTTKSHLQIDNGGA